MPIRYILHKAAALEARRKAANKPPPSPYDLESNHHSDEMTPLMARTSHDEDLASAGVHWSDGHADQHASEREDRLTQLWTLILLGTVAGFAGVVMVMWRYV